MFRDNFLRSITNVSSNITSKPHYQYYFICMTTEDLIWSVMFLLKTVILVLIIHCTIAQINVTSYRDLPPLYTLQNYDDCISRQPSSKYCLLIAEIEPNTHSILWQTIQSLSKDTLHRFRHDLLFFGVCVEQCKDVLRNTDYLSYNNVLSNNVSLANEIIEYYKHIHADDINDRIIYHSFLDRCVNYEFQKKYNLTLKTFIEYCDNKYNGSQNDGLKTIFYVAISMVIILNTLSTIYDYYLKNNKQQHAQNINYYMEELKNTGSSILTSFSVCRNYKKLTKSCQNSSENDLQFTYAFRVFTMFVVILGHVLMIINSIPVQNTEFIENHFDRADAIIFQNGSALIQIFFVLTGFLLKFNFDKKRLIHSDSGKAMALVVYILCFLERYLRFLPPVVVLIFFNSSYLLPLEDGPLWRHISEGERVLCSKYWWKNVLMINNFMMKDSCAHHTWYLAADMQLYELYLIVLITTAKYPRTKQSIYILTGLLAFIIPGFITYFYSLDAFPYLKPESYRYFYFKDVDTFYTTYPQFYCNLGGYLVGFVCAEIYIKYIREGRCAAYVKYRKNLKVQIPLLALVLIIGFGLLFSGILVTNRSSYDKPSIWISLYAACYRNLWAMLGGFILICMLLKFGWIAYEISRLPLFRVLGRITFQMYIWHTTILRILFGFYRQPIYLSDFYVVCQIVLAFMLTIMLAFAIALFVDFPVAHIINGLLKHAIIKLQKNTSGPSGLNAYN